MLSRDRGPATAADTLWIARRRYVPQAQLWDLGCFKTGERQIALSIITIWPDTLRRISRVALIDLGLQCGTVMPDCSETQPAELAGMVANTEPPTGSTPNRLGDTCSARVVGDPVADPAPATLKLYAGDWARFVGWCREQGRPSLPASSETLAAYLVDVAPGLSRGALGRRRSAISTMHRQAGLPTPVLKPATHKALRTAAKPKSVRSAAPPTAAGLVRIAAKCPRDLPGLRDRALLLLAAATLRHRRRGERASGSVDPGADATKPTGVARLFVLALDAEHIRFTPTGVDLQLRTRTDETVPSRTITLTRATTAASCPVRALEEWLRGSETAFGPVFRKVDRWGNVEHHRLGPDAWHRILARRTESPRRTSATTRTR